MKLAEGLTQPLRLGSGAEGDVYRAWQEQPGRVVAVKRSRDGEGARRLAREAKLLSQLAGLPVPGLLEFHEDRKRAVLVLEWLEGISLDALDAASLQEEQRVALLQESCRAVARLHEAGIVHGDLSRSNLLAHARGGIQIVDLGVARRLADLVPTGLGAWEVVAPEVLRGELASPAADVFALGCLALRLWNAVPEDALASRTRWSELGSSGELSRLGEGVHPLVARALAPDAARRPRTAGAMLRELEKVWPEILWPGREIQDAFDAREQRLLEAAVCEAIQRKDWEEAWRLQKLRVELAADPEPLLPQLSRLSRRRLGRSRDGRWVVGLVVAALALLGAGAFFWSSAEAPEPELSRLVEPAPLIEGGAEEELFPGALLPEEKLLPYAVGPQPPDTRLWIDGLPEELPEDDTIWFEPGDYRIEVRDASGNLLRDTLIRFHPQRALRRKATGAP